MDRLARTHILGTHATIPADQGLFLEETCRLHPQICAFTSELFYENRLRSRPGLELQQNLRAREAIAARALEFLILTAARTGEVIGARWSEIDLLDKTWTVPAARMKARREHRIPLSVRALAILREMEATRESDDDNAYVFPGSRRGNPVHG